MTRPWTFGLLLPLALTACAGPDAESPDSCEPNCDAAFVDAGDHAVGYQVVNAEGLEIKAWYPTTVEAGAIDYSITIKLPGWPAEPATIRGEAALDAPIADGGPYPLVVLSHGFSGNPEWYRTLAEHLASHGFFVLAPEHAESDWFTDVVPATLSRPAEVSATLDFAEAGAFASHIDTEAVAVVGHSYGGYTALALAGAQMDLEGFAERCEGVEDEFSAAYFCTTFLDQQDALAGAPSLADPRVDAVVSLAGDAYLFGPSGLEAVTIPVMALGGTADTGTPWDWGTQLTFDHVSSSERYLVGLEGGEHFLPMTDCEDQPWTAALPAFEQGYICSDPAWDKRDALDTVHHFTAAFLGATLRGDAAAIEALDAAHYEGAPMLRYAR
ncbi:dienelactone hydrolase-like protein [Plesiocystis pacifica SIR-1]|uniref:Dienelactone hydrolase-like protein n=1 Tax=Plesiocystis pacifica SIR-1 TaxID=391625 RepID=A6G6T1_9BACT|nr:alpha/beta fold hydrolase [Plesiocystis pacifica]EDM78384.1 dienelactone hydrolase-like protein [Plesiocystis pacifica SIR-1]